MINYKWYFIGLLFITFFIIAVFISFFLYLNTYDVEPTFQRDLHIMRFINVCFPYVDSDTDRIYPGIIDKNRFTEARLNDCYLIHPNTNSFAYRLALISGEEQTSIKTTNFHYYDERLIVPVLIYNNGEFTQGDLRIDFKGN